MDFIWREIIEILREVYILFAPILYLHQINYL